MNATTFFLCLALLACGADEPRRTTPGGGFHTTCMTTGDCGCRSAGSDDSYCMDIMATQLQCLEHTCSLMCSSDLDCTPLFGSTSRCNTFYKYCTTD
jgi:hypothetical protein